MRFQIGDKVETHRGCGAVIGFTLLLNEVNKILIQHDEPFEGGHDGDGAGRDGHCWYYHIDEIIFKETPVEGIKYDDSKLKWSLLPWKQVEEVVKVLQHGAKKYAPDNWKKVQPYKERYFNAAMRHLMAWYWGEKNDPETGLNHLAHAACCILFMLWHDGEEDKKGR
jgi:hypothetical protein